MAAIPRSLVPSLLANRGSLSCFDYPLRALAFASLVKGLRSIGDPKKLQSFLYIVASSEGLLRVYFQQRSWHCHKAWQSHHQSNPFWQAITVTGLLFIAGFFKVNGRHQDILCHRLCWRHPRSLWFWLSSSITWPPRSGLSSKTLLF